MTEKRPITFTLFFLRLLSGFGGGVAGTLMAFVVYFLMASIVPPTEGSSLSVFTVMVIAFVATLTANTSTAVMVTFMDSDKYGRRKTIFTHVFLFNLILFFLTIPLYIIAVQLDIVTGMAGLHFLLSAFVSALIMEVLAGGGYSLLGIYSVSLSTFTSIGIGLILMASGANQLVILFGAMPFVWFMMQLVGSLVELIYDNFLRYYGVDALSTTTDLGGDAEAEAVKKTGDETEEEEETEEDR